MSTPPPKRYDDLAPRPPDGSITLEHLFGDGDGPIEVDVGFGRGMSLFERAARAPEARILGIEIKKKWATWVEERRKRRGLDRIVVFSADVMELLPRCGPPGSVTRMFVHFPDPWWKKRHRKRRVVSEPFLDEAARLLHPGGEMFIQTDVEDRHDDYRQLLVDHPAFDPPSVIDDNPFSSISNRERRAEEDGLPVYRLLSIRSGSS